MSVAANSADPGREPAVAIRLDADQQRYVAYAGDTVAGYIAFRDQDGVRDLLHTEVDAAFEGRGIGSALARFALDNIRAAGKSVVPSCPFVLRWLRRHPGDVDLVPAGDRTRFALGGGVRPAP